MSNSGDCGDLGDLGSCKFVLCGFDKILGCSKGGVCGRAVVSTFNDPGGGGGSSGGGGGGTPSGGGGGGGIGASAWGT